MKEKLFSFDFENNNKGKNSKPSPGSNTLLAPVIMLLNKITNNSTNAKNSIKQLYDFCIKNKHTKIVRYKKITLIIRQLEEILANL